MIPDDEANSADNGAALVPAWLVAVGGIPLLAAMLFEFLAVVGRNTGFAFHASIELVQAAVLLSSSTAIVIATMTRSHAKVRILLNRARGLTAILLRGLNAAGGVVFFASLTIGSAWIVYDVWDAYENSELIHIPYVPLRLFAAVCMLVTAVLYLHRLVGVFRRQ